MSEPLLQLSGLSRVYESGDSIVRALDHIDLTIHAGEFVAIMGQSGSGKSTLMNILGCLDRPTGGTYHVLGRDASVLDADELAALRRDTFGFVFQRYNLLATASAAENVEIPAIYAGLSVADRRARAQELLSRLGLGDRADHRPSQLSGGQQQRVAIARALMNNPPVILADEPTGALDSKSGAEVMDLLKSLHAEGRTVILITHDEKVAAHARRIIRISDGKITDDSGDGKDGVTTIAPHVDRNAHASVMADIMESTKTAMRSLRVNLFRTALTLLGIVIGVAAVVTMLAIGQGSKQKVLDQIGAMGTNLLNIRPGAPGVRSSGDNASLTVDDAMALVGLPNIDVVVPERSGRATLRFGNIDYSTTVQGVGEGFPLARDWPVARGAFFMDRDVSTYAPVLVLGKTVADILFPGGDDPVGRYVLVGNIPFQVIGVMGSKGAAPWGGDQDDAVFVPYTTGMIRLFGQNFLNSITIRVGDIALMEQTEAAIGQVLLQRHGTEDYRIRNTASILAAATETQNTLTILLGTVAAISLLVGGIGVMNIMLVSVTERTREIGIRMATGARRRDIMLQFNTEAAVVCGVGGVLGLLGGFLAGWIASLFQVTVIFTVAPAVLAFTCAFVTGVLFGYLPARKAAWLDPVVALSSE
ncbi:MacB family efflux pump subunit [Micavibrio aeruginosavorus]|uniref:Pyoverdine export ATP-binding/permease protein PvdT n=1 Tax=Micavibrio aeruginosavorus (strain ARL-13) TaxID=856793 RepID=G2KS77_MICAA|nr:MacB family efflux pump subunit [Micavibrio aeruginosavorus]AEP08760.1 ABC transporter family protein [Micavibrio aeruginosavorus ARL-13]